MAVHRTEKSLVVNGGFKGAPSNECIEEIGDEVVPAYRNLGMATEFADALIQHAFSYKEVNKIMAHTLAEENASVRVLKKRGGEFIQPLHDPEESEIWQWIRNR
ncbi:MAG: GNAT family N-acetyltransferase [Bacteroidetes Order II. Incertae sedis bacterium]|nr:GNAT family N-acetyltransferase [Bacteroidetes Order II. bacterium]